MLPSSLFRSGRNLIFFLLTLSFCFFESALWAQQDSATIETTLSNESSPKVLMDHLLGDWVMTGTIGKQKITHDVHVEHILGKRYVRIHEVSREKDANGEWAYEAWIHFAWDSEKEEYAVMWLDNTGTTNFAEEGVGHGSPDGDTIPFAWKFSDGSGIHNTFVYNRTADTWSWTIDNVSQTNAKSRFADVILKRK